MIEEKDQAAETATATEEATTDTAAAAESTDTEGLSVEEELVEVTVTKEMLDENPEMVEQGLKEGDTIKVSKEPTEEGESGTLQ